MDTLLQRARQHLSSTSLLVLGLALWGFEHPWLAEHLPINGKPLFSLMIISNVVLLEFVLAYIRKANAQNKVLNQQIAEGFEGIRNDADITRVKGAINSIYFRYESSGGKWLKQDNNIVEFYAVRQEMKALEINSYHEYRITEMEDSLKNHRGDT